MDQGLFTWSLGYRDEHDYIGSKVLDGDEAADLTDEDENESEMLFDLQAKIFSDEVNDENPLTEEELKEIQTSQRLITCYENRWYRWNSPDCFFIVVN